MQVLKSRAVDPSGELGRLLVALDERSLNLLLAGDGRKRPSQDKYE
jgi:hypothetical protein